MLNIRPGRLFTAVLLVIACIVLGLSAPLVLDFEASEFKLSNVAVLAAPRDGYEISSPVEIVSALGIRLKGGTIAHESGAGGTLNQPAQNGPGKLIIDGGVFHISGRPPSDVGPALSEPASPLVEAVRQRNFGTLLVRGSTIRVVLPDGRAEELSEVVAEVTNSRKGNLAIQGTGSVRGQAVSFDLSAIATKDGKPGLPVALKMRLKSPFLDVTFDGHAGSSDALQLRGQMELAMSDLRQTARWLGAPWPSGSALKNVLIKGDFEWLGPVIAFDQANFKLDGNEATGTLALNLAGERPALTGTFAAQSLDLTPYLVSDAERPLPSLLKWFGTNQKSGAAPIARYLDADIRASSAKLLIGKVALGRFAASLSLRKGRLLADIAEIDIDGGRGSGQLTADLASDRPQISVRGRLEEIDASRTTMALLGYSAVQGLSTITLDLATEGETASDLLDALRGKIALNLHERGRIGIDMKSLLEAAQNGKSEGWATATRGQTSVDALEAKFRVDKGIVASELFEANIGNNLLRAIGTVSLVARQMDLRVMLDPVAEAVPAAARDVLVLRGPWSSPSIKVER